MVLGKQEFQRMFRSVAALFEENSELLSEIDSKFGDGDHGVTIGKIAKLIREQVDCWGQESIHDFLEKLGDGVMGISGGSAGPLYGTLLGGLAGPLQGEEAVDGPLLKAMLTNSLEEMREITPAKVGDKTMMDALIPAVAAAQNAPDVPEMILVVAAQAAQMGAEASKSFVSKFGRAKSYKEQTVGTPDVGAVSTSLFFVGLAEGLE